MNQQIYQKYTKNIIEKYEKLSKLSQVCLADYAANYVEKRTTYKSDSDDEYDEYDNQEIKKRKEQKIIRFCRYKLQEDRYNYFREQVYYRYIITGYCSYLGKMK